MKENNKSKAQLNSKKPIVKINSKQIEYVNLQYSMADVARKIELSYPAYQVEAEDNAYIDNINIKLKINKESIHLIHSLKNGEMFYFEISGLGGWMLNYPAYEKSVRVFLHYNGKRKSGFFIEDSCTCIARCIKEKG